MEFLIFVLFIAIVFYWLKKSQSGTSNDLLNAALSEKLQEYELQDFMTYLKSLDNETLGLTVVLATLARQQIKEEMGLDVINPEQSIKSSPKIIYTLSSYTEKLQKEGNLAMAGAYMVWVHTLRASVNPQLRDEMKAAWLLLREGFPFINVGLETCRMMGLSINTDSDYTAVPDNF